MAQNTINNRSSTLTVDNALTVSAGGASITGNTTIQNGVFDAGDDATSNAINIATGAAEKDITVGNTSGTTSVQVNIGSGTGVFDANSASGNVITAFDSGEFTRPLHPAFLIRNNTENEVTGDGTVHNMGSVGGGLIFFDKGNNISIGGGGSPSEFVASINGRYYLSINFSVGNIDDGSGVTEYTHTLFTSNRSYRVLNMPTRQRVSIFAGVNNFLQFRASVIADMDAADIARWQLTAFNGAKTVDNIGENRISGFLAC